MVNVKEFLKNSWMESSIDDWWLTIDPIIYTQNHQPVMIEYYHGDEPFKKRGFIKKRRFFSSSIPETMFTMINIAGNARNDPDFRYWYPDDSPLQKKEIRLISSKLQTSEEREENDSQDVFFDILHVEGLVFHPYNLKRVTKRSLLEDLEFYGKKAGIFAAQVYFKSTNKACAINRFNLGKKGDRSLLFLSNHEIMKDMVIDELVASNFRLGIQVLVACADKGELVKNLIYMKALLEHYGFKTVISRRNDKNKNLRAFLGRKPLSMKNVIPPSMLKNLIATWEDKAVLDESNSNVASAGKHQEANSSKRDDKDEEIIKDRPVPPVLDGIRVNS